MNSYSLVSPAALAAIVPPANINIREAIPLTAKGTAKARATGFVKNTRALNTHATATHSQSHDKHIGHGQTMAQDDTGMMWCRNLLRSGLYPDLSRHQRRRAEEGMGEGEHKLA